MEVTVEEGAAATPPEKRSRPVPKGEIYMVVRAERDFFVPVLFFTEEADALEHCELMGRAILAGSCMHNVKRRKDGGVRVPGLADFIVCSAVLDGGLTHGFIQELTSVEGDPAK
jgi:hypothetical protein